MASNKKVKITDFIEWEDRETGLKLYGTVRNILENSVVVDIIGMDDLTVVSHKRYRVIKEEEVDATACEQFRKTGTRLVHRKWF